MRLGIFFKDKGYFGDNHEEFTAESISISVENGEYKIMLTQDSTTAPRIIPRNIEEVESLLFLEK